jgi:hypothetical protein
LVGVRSGSGSEGDGLGSPIRQPLGGKVLYGVCANASDGDELEQEEQEEGKGITEVPFVAARRRAARVRFTWEMKVLLPVRSARW